MEENTAGTRTTSCVVTGRFNPAILLPAWIVKEGILPDGEVEVGQVFGGTLVQFRLGGYMWQASFSKFEVHAEAEGLNPGEFVAKVLDRLTHTPVRGVGNNFAVAYEDSLCAGLHRLATCPLAAVVTLQEREILTQGVTLSLAHEGEAVARVALELEPKQAEVRFNFHRDCASALAGAQAARRWVEDQAEAALLLERILTYAHDSTYLGNQHAP